MLPPHTHVHGQAHEHGHPKGHAHGPSSPHPAQTVPWSILRMALVARLGTALAVSAGLWAAVLLTTVRW
nr:hypothetical protein [Nitrobacter vulgaris]